MVKCYDVALKTVEEFIKRNKLFKYTELANEILKKDGCLRVAPNYTVLEYLSRLEYHGIVKKIGVYYIPDYQKYKEIYKRGE